MILKSCKNHVRLIKINRIEKRNACTFAMYQDICEILNKDANDDEITFTIITGQGDYFCSGNDLKNLLANPEKPESVIFEVKKLCESFINYPKPLIAIVNGPAFGAGVALAALCDIIYASSNAYFDATFVKLKVSAEGAASFTLPFSMGRSKASEMILLNHKLSAKEAYNFGLISGIIPYSQIENFIQMLHHESPPLQPVMVNTRLLMHNVKAKLLEACNNEANELTTLVNSPYFGNVIKEMKLTLNKQSKL